SYDPKRTSRIVELSCIASTVSSCSILQYISSHLPSLFVYASLSVSGRPLLLSPSCLTLFSA
ncbi:hypothetical protein BGY98DRAFT_1036406, partial [Russula aff. rugulosa BPL654]